MIAHDTPDGLKRKVGGQTLQVRPADGSRLPDVLRLLDLVAAPGTSASRDESAGSRAGVASVPVTKDKLAVGKGLFFSTITADQAGTLFLLPPRYRGHEDVVARAYLMGGGVKDAGLRKAWR